MYNLIFLRRIFMDKYTEEQKIEALKFFEDGCTAREIFEVMDIPMGTLYRWKSEHAKPGASGTEVAQLRVEIAELKARLNELEPYIVQLKTLLKPTSNTAKPFTAFKLSVIATQSEQQKAL